MKGKYSVVVIVLGILLLANSAFADDVKYYSAAMGMPYFVVYDYRADTYNGRLENDDPDWVMLMHFPIVVDYLGTLSTTMPAAHARAVFTSGSSYCSLYSQDDTGTSSYVQRNFTNGTSYNEYTWASVPTYSTYARRYLACGFPKKSDTGVRSGLSGYRVWDRINDDHYNDKKVFPGLLCRAQDPTGDIVQGNYMAINVSTVGSRNVMCPIISDNTGDLDATVYVYKNGTSFSCAIRDIHPTSGSAYYNYQSSTTSLGSDRYALNFNVLTSHYTNGYRAIRCQIPASEDGTVANSSNIIGYFVDEQD